MLLDWRVVTEPAEEPVTLAEGKAQCRVLHSAEDDSISSFIVAARQIAEAYMWRALITQTRELTLDRWPYNWRDGTDTVRLPGGVVTSVTSVTYTAADGTETALDPGAYVADVTREPVLVYPAYGTLWPTLRDARGAVRIRYVTGYGAAADVPDSIKAGIRLLVGYLYKEREGEKLDWSAAYNCWNPHRLMEFR